MTNRLGLLPILASSSFLLFLSAVYEVASQAQAEEATRTVVSIADGIRWTQLYPDWFFQLLLLLMIVALSGVVVSTTFYLGTPYTGGKPILQIGLDSLFLSYLAFMFSTAVYVVLTSGPLRITWFPVVGANAYAVTVLIYTTAGFWLFRRFGWKAMVPLALTGVLQEATWNFAYFTLYPSFPASILSKSWVEYVLVIIVAAPVLIFLQKRWFRIRLRRSPWVLAFPAYFLLYYLLGMPTVAGPPMTFHTNSLVFEATYVLTCMISYLKGVELDARH